MDNLKEVQTELIDPSPYQHRRVFHEDKLNELAKSIERDGLIEPVVVRVLKDGRHELIAGERRLRAYKLVSIPVILARIVDVPDIQARRMSAAENMQRADLSPVEEIEATVEMVDAEMIDNEYHLNLGDTPYLRVRRLLGKLKSIEEGTSKPRASNENVHKLLNNIVQKLETIFTNLPSSKKWRSFLQHDLPLLNRIDNDVLDLGARIRATKARLKSLQKMKKDAPIAYEKVRAAIEDTEADGKITVSGPFVDRTIEVEEVSAAELNRITNDETILINKDLEGDEESEPEPSVHFSSATPEWYTPKHIITCVIQTFGVIDLDPCSDGGDTPNIPAITHFTKEDDGLSKQWAGRTYMNPPYGNEIILWVKKILKEYLSGRIPEAIILAPARTDTQWFQLLREFPKCFITGRLKFVGGNSSAPFPSMLVYLGQNIETFCNVFSDVGDVYELKEAYIEKQQC